MWWGPSGHRQLCVRRVGEAKMFDVSGGNATWGEWDGDPFTRGSVPRSQSRSRAFGAGAKSPGGVGGVAPFGELAARCPFRSVSRLRWFRSRIVASRLE